MTEQASEWCRTLLKQSSAGLRQLHSAIELFSDLMCVLDVRSSKPNDLKSLGRNMYSLRHVMCPQLLVFVRLGILTIVPTKISKLSDSPVLFLAIKSIYLWT